MRLGASDEEQQRLDDARSGAAPWRLWGPYLAERAWGTVREDYSADGDAWRYFPHDHARSRAYRWNEDGLLGICDDSQRLCFALALWNGEDAMLKERAFGLYGPRGQSRRGREGLLVLPRQRAVARVHAGAVQVSSARVSVRAAASTRIAGAARTIPSSSCSTPASSTTIGTSTSRSSTRKASPTDILIRITVANRGPDDARPSTSCRRSGFATRGAWGIARRIGRRCPRCRRTTAPRRVLAEHETLGRYHLTCDGEPELLFTENETNVERLFGLAESHAVREGRVSRVRRERARGRGESRARGHQGGGALSPDGAGRRRARRFVCDCRPR